MNLDSGIRAYIAAMAEAYAPTTGDETFPEQRSLFERTRLPYRRPYPAGMKTEDLELAPGVPARIYRNPAAAPQPAILYFHGGGWVLGSIESHDPICAEMAERTGAAVVNVGYRLAPEDPFPAAFDDSYAALLAVAADAGAHGLEGSRIAVAGDSAGANLAAAVCLAARDRDGPPIAGQALIYPALGLDFDLPSYHEKQDGPLLTRDAMIWFWDQYVREEDRQNPYAAPLLAADLTGLPPAFVTIAEHDPLRDDGRLYAQRLREAAVPVEERIAPELVHGWLFPREASPAGRAEFVEICRALTGFLDR